MSSQKSCRRGAQTPASYLARRAAWLERAPGLCGRWRGSLDSALLAPSRSRREGHCAAVRIGRVLSRAWFWKAFSDHPPSRTCVESQKGVARVLRDEAQSTSSQQAPGPDASSTTIGMRSTPQCRMVDRLHVRRTVGWSTLPCVQLHRRLQPGSLSDRSGLESSSHPRHPHLGTHRGLARLSQAARSLRSTRLTTNPFPRTSTSLWTSIVTTTSY